MERLAASIAAIIPDRCLIFLQGGLGVGKTTFVRGFLRYYGHIGVVKSPTYTLVEPYQLAGRLFYHFDLYRLVEPEELEAIGIRDYFDGQAISLVEWPQQARGGLPQPDLIIDITIAQQERRVILNTGSGIGTAVLDNHSTQTC